MKASSHMVDLTLSAAHLPEALPTAKQEAWKYSNLSRILSGFQCTPLCTTIGCLEAALPVVAGPQAVFHNGVFAEPFSQSLTLAPGVTLVTAPAQLPTTQLDELDTLPAPFHYTLNVQGKIQLPLHLIHVMSGQPSISRVTVNLEPGAKLTLIEHHVAAPRFASWQHTGIEINLGANAQLTHSVLQTLPPLCMLTRRAHVHVAPQASYTASQLQLGATFSRLETHTHLTSNTTFAFTGLSLSRHAQQHDTTLQTHHADVNNQTHIRQRNLVDDQAHAVFQGKFYVAQAAQKTNAYMHCHNMLLNDSARTSHKPELEIYADDVKCSHGAATGGLDAAQLFYLRARGLTPAAARGLLLSGYAEEFIAQFPEFLRASLQTKLTTWLAEAPFQPTEDADFVPLQGEWLAERAAEPHLRVVANFEDEITDE